MKSLFKMFLIFFGVFAAVFSLSAKDLNVYVTMLDRAERNFWVALFAPPNSSTRKAYKENLIELEQSARRIDDLRRRNGIKVSYGDLKAPSMLLNSLLGTHSAFRKRVGVLRITMTTFARVRKELLQRGFSSNKQAVNESDIPEEDFLDAINAIRDENIDTLAQIFTNTKNLRPYEQEVLLRTAQTFYTVIIKARLTVFKLRKSDPLFGRQSTAQHQNFERHSTSLPRQNRYGNRRR